MDMFPTTLAALGVEIEGDKLGIGVNLFSDKQTLAEKYGIETLNN
jgi:phosphoglycerol transferase